MRDLFVGLDVGTSQAKAAAFTSDGTRVCEARAALPDIRSEGAARWQPVLEVVSAAEEALFRLSKAGAPRIRWSHLCLTTQRDTLILLDEHRVPLDALGRQGPPALISWRDRRPALQSPGSSEIRGAQGLPAFLSERWTGMAAECEAARSWRLNATWIGAQVGVPPSVPLGASTGEWDGVAVHLAGGDKNCEFLAAGVTSPETAGLSLGSAISLGMISATRPPERPGVVVSPGALLGRWNAETGLPLGMDGVELLGDPLNVPAPPSSGIFIVPYFAPPLDAAPGSGALPTIAGATPRTPRSELRQAWARGVVCELRRLRPHLEASAQARIREIVITGGGSAAGLPFARYMADAFQVPVEETADPWLASRGAVACVGAAMGEGAAGASVEIDAHRSPPALGAQGGVLPDPGAREGWNQYWDQWMLVRDQAFDHGPEVADRSQPDPESRSDV